MNITPISNYVAPLAGTQPTQASPVSTLDPDGDAGGGAHAHKAHGGGHIRQALMQALQSLGLSMPQSPGSAPSSSATSGSTDSDGDADGLTAGVGGVKQDLHDFMHALFQAVKADAASTSSTSTSTTADNRPGFASGLSTLISQVSSGTAPSDLQAAFSKLATDLQPASSAESAGSATTGSTSTMSSQATLQQLLSALQQDLGYGSTSASAALSNSISTQA